MKKFHLLLGGAVGFVLGSKAGPGPYQALEKQVRRAAGRSDVRAAVDQVKSAASERVPDVTDRFKPASQSGQTGQTGPRASAGVGGSEPADLTPDSPEGESFGHAAAKKEERLDSVVAAGGDPASLERSEET